MKLNFSWKFKVVARSVEAEGKEKSRKGSSPKKTAELTSLLTVHLATFAVITSQADVVQDYRIALMTNMMESGFDAWHWFTPTTSDDN